MKTGLKNLLFTLCVLIMASAYAGGVYQEPDDFINEVFDNEPPEVAVLWLDTELKNQVVEILGHKYRGLRVRYWQEQEGAASRSAWILEEVGKEKPITAGIVISNSRIERVKVLVFRESRGWEVRHNFFTDQFKQAGLAEKNRLDRNIDNISGATLSVRAVEKLARIALLLDQHVQNKPK